MPDKTATVKEVLEANSWPKRYRCEFIEPGVCDYSDILVGEDGKPYEDPADATIYIGSDTLDRMLNTFIGKPVVNELHNDLTPEQAFKISNDDLEAVADGVVYEVGKAENGWYYCDMLIWDKKTQDNIDLYGYSVSCSYALIRTGPGGSYHGIRYGTEILDGCYTHNAIVKKPRYERAKVYELPMSLTNNTVRDAVEIITNSEGDKNMKKRIMHLFNGAKKEVSPAPKEEEVSIEQSYILLPNGEKASLEACINAYMEKADNMKEGDDDKEDKDKVDNAESAQDEKAEDVVENSEASDKEDDEEDKVDNAEAPQDVVAEQTEGNTAMTNSQPEKSERHFIAVKNAVNKIEDETILVNTTVDRFAKGKQRYGSKEVK